MTKKISLADVLNVLHLELKGKIDEDFINQCSRWWLVKSVLFPECFAVDGARSIPTEEQSTKIRNDYRVVATFPFSDYKQWYAQFFLNEIGSSPKLIAHSQRIAEMKLIEQVLKGVAPDDPTIYPLAEQPLGNKGRTRTYGGAIDRIDAILPRGGNLVVVAKKVPEQLTQLYHEESGTHQALCELGYRDSVAEPIALGTANQVITYPRLQGDLAPLRDQDESVKKEYLSTALDILLTMSLDLKEQTKEATNNPHRQYIAEQLRRRDWTPQYLTQRFVENFLLRNAAAEGHIEPWDAPLGEFAEVLFGKKEVRQLSEEARQYPTLIQAVQSPAVQQVYQAYLKVFAPRLAQLPRFPGHNDFTVDNILAAKIEKGENGKLLISGLRLHDIGLVNAPFQSYLFDILVSCQAAPETREEILRETYRKLERACTERAVPFYQSYPEFRAGYQLVSSDKMLKQAALSYLDEQTYRP